MRYLHVFTINERIEEIRIRKKRSFLEVNKSGSAAKQIRLWRFIESRSMLSEKFPLVGNLIAKTSENTGGSFHVLRV